MASDDAKLFVAGLPDSVSEDVLRQLFEATGGQVVNVSIPKDRATGRPRGFGFVTMSTPDEAKSAREALDGSLQAGRSISVRPFQADPPRGDGPREGGFRGEGGGFRGPRESGPSRGGPPPQDRTLYVGNLPYDTSQEEVSSLVNGVCDNGVVRVNLPMDADGRKRGFGFVTLASSEAAKTAAEALANAELRGRRLIVNIAHPKGDRPAREGGDFGGGRDFGGPPPRDFGGGGGRDFAGPPPRDFGGGGRDFAGPPPRDFGGPPRPPAKNDRRRGGGGGPSGGDDGFGRKPRGGGGGGRGGGRGRDYDDWDDE